MLIAPSTAITPNQTHMIGPKNRPTAPVPWRWIQNSPVRMIAVTGSTKSLSCGAMMPRPSTAESTEIAGVIMLSP